MGLSSTKPEFVYVLADKQVKAAEEVCLSCEANTYDVTATWEKAGHRLQCVQGKHTLTSSGTKHTLVIRNAEQADEGNYTIKLRNDSGTASCSAMVIVDLVEWRIVKWRQRPKIQILRNFKMSNEVKELRFLLHGPVGAGKSSIINTIKSIFERHQHINCLTAADTSGTSFTKNYQKFTVGSDESGDFPFAFYDVMGLEEGQSEGACTNDIIQALKGHLPDDYEFRPWPISEDNRHYIHNPTLNHKIHCLVSVIAADRISLMSNKVIEKMKIIREEASKLGIPQVLFMTRVDRACEQTQKNLCKVYQSKKIKEKMIECSNRLGIAMNCIFPVKNYHEEVCPNENLNCLILDAFSQIVDSAHDYVKQCSRNQISIHPSSTLLPTKMRWDRALEPIPTAMGDNWRTYRDRQSCIATVIRFHELK